MSGDDIRLNTVRDGLRTVLEALEESESAIRAHRPIDLSGADESVDALCHAALSLPRAEGSQLEPELRDLISRLDCLATAIRNWRQEMAPDGGPHTDLNARSALGAYRKQQL